MACNLRELQKKSMEKFGKSSLPRIHLDSDGTEIDDEDYFQTLEPNTELIAVFSGEQWVDVRLNFDRLCLNEDKTILFSTAYAILDDNDTARRRNH